MSEERHELEVHHHNQSNKNSEHMEIDPFNPSHPAVLPYPERASVVKSELPVEPLRNMSIADKVGSIILGLILSFSIFLKTTKCVSCNYPLHFL
jgi:hypothetical protein